MSYLHFIQHIPLGKYNFNMITFLYKRHGNNEINLRSPTLVYYAEKIQQKIIAISALEKQIIKMLQKLKL